MRHVAFALVGIFMWGVSPYAVAGSCDMMALLADRDVIPFQLGRLEKKALATAPNDLDSFEELSKQVDQSKEKDESNRWEQASDTTHKGTRVYDPSNLEGRIVTIQLKPGILIEGSPIVSGKVTRIEGVNTNRIRPERVVFDVQTTSGIVRIKLSEAKTALVHNGKEGSRTQRLRRGVKIKLEKLVTAIRNYVKEVKENPARLLFPERDSIAEAQFSALGFKQWESADHGKLYWALSPLKYLTMRRAKKKHRQENSDEPFKEFKIYTPLHGMHHLLQLGTGFSLLRAAKLYDKHVGFRTREGRNFYRVPRRLSNPIMFLIDTQLFFLAYNWVNEEDDELLAGRKRKRIHEGEEKWIKAVHTDPFLSRVKADLKHGHITESDAVEEAYLKTEALESYYDYMAEIYDARQPWKSNALILQDDAGKILFPGTTHIYKNGIIEEPGISKRRNKPITEEVVIELMEHNHRLLRRRPLLEQWVAPSKHLPSMLRFRNKQGELPLLGELESLVNDPYLLALREIHRMGDLSQERLLQLLHENARWEEKFARWNTLDVDRVNLRSGSKIKLDDFRFERLTSINNGWGALEERAQIDVFPHDKLEFRNRLETYWGNLKGLHYLRRMNPFLKQLRFLRPYATKFARGRLKGAIRGKKIKKAVVITSAGEVSARAANQGTVANVLDVLGKAIVLGDVSYRIRERRVVDEHVEATGTLVPFVSYDSKLSKEEEKRIERIMRKMKRVSSRTELRQNPYLDYYLRNSRN